MPNEQVDGSDLCAHHLAKAVEDWRSILTIHISGDSIEVTP